ncbi:MAG: oligopeptide/dipeptide ABC transporter ATP-binding protein [Myxococcaceae bacterium]
MLEARDVSVTYRERGRVVDAVRAVSLRVAERERVGVIGESASGKSSLLRALLGLEPLAGGSATFEGTPTHEAPPAVRRRFQPVFQDVGAALDPLSTVRASLAEPFEIHGVPCDDARLTGLLESVQLGRELLDRRPRELSVGQRQRVNLARALALEPKLLLLDEPVSALDVSVQAQVINLLRSIAAQRSLALLVVTHDLDVVAHLSDRLLVMFAGRVVEAGPTAEVLAAPRHPYTRLLVKSRTEPVEGEVTLAKSGCAFSLRCPDAREECRAAVPPLSGTARQSACVVFPGA